MFGAAARGTGLIAIAVVIGIVLLQYSDDPPPPTAGGQEPAAAPLSPREDGDTAAEAPDETTTSSSSSTSSSGPRAPAELTVQVLNASGRNAVAKPMSERLAVVGYKTLEPGNAPVRPATSVLCKAGLDREATALVGATGLPGKTGPLPADSDLPGADQADCVVVIGSG